MPRPRKSRPLIRNTRNQFPAGLRGREIGLYYRDLHMRGGKQKKENEWIHLKIPQAVIAQIYKCLDNIEKIAFDRNIYFPPARKLHFIRPSNNDNFIPINVPDSNRLTHTITNIRKKDEDVLFVKTEPEETIELSDSSDDNSDNAKKLKSMTNDNDFNVSDKYTNPTPSTSYSGFDNTEKTLSVKGIDGSPGTNLMNTQDIEKAAKKVKPKTEEKFRPCPGKMDHNTTVESVASPINMIPQFVEPKGNADLNTSSDDITDKVEIEKEDNPTLSDDIGIFVSNNYTNITLGTLSDDQIPVSKHQSIINEAYKYTYEDIITGTFEEKLDECMLKGIEINEKNEAVDSLNIHLQENHQSMLRTNEKYKKMLKFREMLPTYKKAKDVLDVINNNQVIVISGETGCGKSTQVPQLILDEAISKGRGANVKVLVTEPRRIAASSLALRVADERGERTGNSVGYAVRLEAVMCRDRGSIMFCTTGVLLVELEQNQALGSYSHIILDEVHERDCQVDLAMCMLKQVLQKRKDLKLILMSATIDADTLSKYYDDCPMLHIEGLAYPVKDVYMEDILQMTNYRLPPAQNFRNHREKRWHKYANRRNPAAENMEKQMQYRATIAPWIQSVKAKMDSKILEQIQDHRIEDLNYDLVVELLKHICRGEPGAILVFLPGIGEISKLTTAMNKSSAFPSRTHEIYTLHSKLPTVDQNKIFIKPPDGVRKIIIATNIAETSITIDDVVYVVDCGKIKYKGLDVDKNHATLQVEWVSKANLRQRRGRAGRCQPGICYHLLTTHRAEILPDRLLPELQRSNLLEEVLCIKKLRLGKAEDALKTMPAVPAEKTIQWAIKHLQQIGALDENETLTPLGWHLARLPVHPAAGKLLVLGALFGCLDRAASVAAVWGFKDPFQLVIGKEEEVEQTRRSFAMGEPSDHVAISEAIIEWEKCSSYHEKQQFAYRCFLSQNTLKLLSDMKRQFADNLYQMGFLRRADVKSSWPNRNANNLSVFKAIVAAALYPNIATVRWLNTKYHNPKRPMRIKTYTPEDGKVSLHPSSVMYTKMFGRGNRQPICRNHGANWLVYWLKQKSTELFLLDVTCVYTLPLLFFGDLNFTQGNNPDECLISISSFKVCCMKETTELLFQLRSLLDQVLTSKVSNSEGGFRKNIEFDEAVLGAVIDLISAEDEGTQYLGDDDDDQFERFASDDGDGTMR